MTGPQPLGRLLPLAEMCNVDVTLEMLEVDEEPSSGPTSSTALRDYATALATRVNRTIVQVAALERRGWKATYMEERGLLAVNAIKTVAQVVADLAAAGVDDEHDLVVWHEGEGTPATLHEGRILVAAL